MEDAMNKIRIKAGNVTQEATLYENNTATAIWNALPIKGTANRWGNEIYFEIPVSLKLAEDAIADVEIGDLGYWPTGHAFCIFWGPTPVSPGSKPRAYSPVNVFGKITGDAKEFGKVEDSETITIEKYA
jgi:hypothetical protein